MNIKTLPDAQEMVALSQQGFPRDRASWQLAVELADYYALLHRYQHIGKQFQLLTEHGALNVERCTELLAVGETMGFKPRVPMCAVQKAEV
jgi:hypothetical protein